MMPVPSVHCEARKIAYRQTKDGVAVSFVIHPADVPDTLALAPLGQRYMLVLAMIDDDERAAILESPSLTPAERPGVETGISPTARARASEMGKERYAGLPPMQQALTRACLLVRDERFQAWAPRQRSELDPTMLTEEGAADFIREHCCDGKSRGLIAEDPEAYRKFLALETMFHQAIGLIPEMRP